MFDSEKYADRNNENKDYPSKVNGFIIHDAPSRKNAAPNIFMHKLYQSCAPAFTPEDNKDKQIVFN
jgi:hypothetical protein